MAVSFDCCLVNGHGVFLSLVKNGLTALLSGCWLWVEVSLIKIPRLAALLSERSTWHQVQTLTGVLR